MLGFKKWFSSQPAAAPIHYDGPVRYGDRDIVVVMVNGKRQSFYRSTGQNSGMAGKWLPFDGIGFHPSQGLWFVKDRFVNAQFNRYGNQELMNVGKTLDGQKIRSGRQMSDPIQINKWIGSDESNTANTILIFRKEHGA